LNDQKPKWTTGVALPNYIIQIVDALWNIDKYPMGRYHSRSNYTVIAIAKLILEDAERLSRTKPKEYNQIIIDKDGKKVKMDDVLETIRKLVKGY